MIHDVTIGMRLISSEASKDLTPGYRERISAMLDARFSPNVDFRSVIIDAIIDEAKALAREHTRNEETRAMNRAREREIYEDFVADHNRKNEEQKRGDQLRQNLYVELFGTKNAVIFKNGWSPSKSDPWWVWLPGIDPTSQVPMKHVGRFRKLTSKESAVADQNEDLIFGKPKAGYGATPAYSKARQRFVLFTVVQEATANLRIEWTEKLRRSEIAMPDGSRVTYGQATVEQLEMRMNMCVSQADTAVINAAICLKAIQDIEKAGTANLDEAQERSVLV